MQNEMLSALQERDAPAVAALLDREPRLLSHVFSPEESPAEMGRGCGENRPLHLAAYFGGADVLDLLLERGADPEFRNDMGRHALHVALEHNNCSARHLVERGFPLDIVSAACLGNLERMRELLAEDPALANDDSTKLSPLGWACYHGALDSARLLIEAGARMDDGELRCCAGVANVELGRLLLESGADVNERCAEDGSTALHVAAAHIYTTDAAAFVQFLLDAGADRSLAAGPERWTPLQLACRRRDAQSAQGTTSSDEGFRNYAAVIALLEDG